MLRINLPLALLGLAIATATPADAADPLGPFTLDPDSPALEVTPAPAVDAQGRLLLAWTQLEGENEIAVAAPLAADGSLFGPPQVWGEGRVEDNGATGAGFLAILRDRSGSEWGRALAPNGSGVGQRLPLGILRDLEVRGDPRGGALAVGGGPDGLVAVRYDSAGRPTDEPFVLQRDAFFGDVGIDAHGTIVLAYLDVSSRLFAQRYTPAGRPVGRKITVAGAGGSAIRVAVLPDGRFVVFYAKALDTRVWARAFRANGKAVGSPFLVSNDLIDTRDRISVASDNDGTLFAVWKGHPGNTRTAIEGRFVSASGALIGAQFELGRAAGEEEPRFLSSPRTVRSSTGSFLVFWGREGNDPFDLHLRGQRVFSGPGGDDPCILLRGALRCDLRHDGGVAEVVYPLAVGTGELALLGDLDGDGRDEPCRYRTGQQFLCDVDKDGVTDLDETYGAPGDTPLLGDIDGDGKDELCRFDGASFHCAKLPLGSAAEIDIHFGGTESRPVLGDADGDGDDDPCVFLNIHFLCDTDHDGAPDTLQFFTAEQGEATLAADMDGDGKVDPCGIRAGRFRCALSSTGRIQTLSFGGAQGVPLLGNLDGR